MRWAGAVLGFGQVAEHGHWPAWKGRNDASLVAVADPDPGRRARATELIPGVRTYPDAQALLAAEPLDFVDIAAPPADHMSLAVTAAHAGCHVLCEKPLAISSADYDTTRAAVQKAGVRLVPVHNWRHAPHYMRVMELLRRDAIGTVRHVRIEVVRTAPAAATPWRRQIARAGGGILVDHGWHAFYLLQRFCGERPTGVQARTAPAAAIRTLAEDEAWCTLTFPSSTADVYLTWTGSKRRTRWHLTGDRGELVVEDDWLELDSVGDSERSRFPESLSASSHHPQWFAPVIEEFFRDLRGHTISPSDPPGAALAEAEVCLLLTRHAYASAASGGARQALPSAHAGAAVGGAS